MSVVRPIAVVGRLRVRRGFPRRRKLQLAAVWQAARLARRYVQHGELCPLVGVHGPAASDADDGIVLAARYQLDRTSRQPATHGGHTMDQGLPCKMRARSCSNSQSDCPALRLDVAHNSPSSVRPTISTSSNRCDLASLSSLRASTCRSSPSCVSLSVVTLDAGMA